MEVVAQNPRGTWCLHVACAPSDTEALGHPCSWLFSGFPLWPSPAWRRDKWRVGRVRCVTWRTLSMGEVFLPGKVTDCHGTPAKSFGLTSNSRWWLPIRKEAVLQWFRNWRTDGTWWTPLKPRTHGNCPIRHPFRHVEWHVESLELWGSLSSDDSASGWFSNHTPIRHKVPQCFHL